MPRSQPFVSRSPQHEGFMHFDLCCVVNRRNTPQPLQISSLRRAYPTLRVLVHTSVLGTLNFSLPTSDVHCVTPVPWRAGDTAMV